MESKAAAAQVGNVLSQCFLAVTIERGIFPRHQLQAVVLFYQLFATCLELRCVVVSPPVDIVAPLVEMAAIAVKAVGQLMADGSGDVSQLQGVLIIITHVWFQQVRGVDAHNIAVSIIECIIRDKHFGIIQVV